jgi:SPFH domain / Band 7 family
VSVGQRARRMAAGLGAGERLAQVVGDAVEGASREFAIDAGDFLSAREQGSSSGTRIEQVSASLADAGEILNQSFPEYSETGQFTNVITPVVIPKRRATRAVLPVTILVIAGLVGAVVTAPLGAATALFGPHYWVALLILAVYLWWRRSVVMVPEGCHALITKFGKLETVAGPGRTTLLNPWKQVSYLVNTAKEYPYNAPIREAPTASGVKASVDLFLQFRIEDPAEFIFVLGAVKGFSDKLENAISEVTRSLIYQQRAEGIYDLVGESTQSLLDTLNDRSSRRCG